MVAVVQLHFRASVAEQLGQILDQLLQKHPASWSLECERARFELMMSAGDANALECRRVKRANRTMVPKQEGGRPGSKKEEPAWRKTSTRGLTIKTCCGGKSSRSGRVVDTTQSGLWGNRICGLKKCSLPSESSLFQFLNQKAQKSTVWEYTASQENAYHDSAIHPVGRVTSRLQAHSSSSPRARSRGGFLVAPGSSGDHS